MKFILIVGKDVRDNVYRESLTGNIPLPYKNTIFLIIEPEVGLIEAIFISVVRLRV